MLADVPRWQFWRRRSAVAALQSEVLELQARVATLEEGVGAFESISQRLQSLEEKLEAALEVQDADPPETQPATDETAELITRADALHAANDVDGLFELIKDADTSDDEIAWRVARAHHDKAEDSAEAARDAVLKERLLRDGLAIAEAAKDASGSGYSEKWYAILLGRLGDFLPTKEKVGNSYKIKEALERAAALLPEDASVQTALGQWCYKVASISWIERNVAKALFGEPPESSYEEALSFVTRSHEIRPSKKASLFAGLSNAKLNDAPKAAEWLELCLSLESAGEGDRDIDDQAKAALAKVR